MSGNPRIRHILFYGTLCAKQPAHDRLRLRRSLAWVGERAIRAVLYDLGPYPGLVLNDGATRVELYRIDEPSILPRLDRYEGFDAARPAASPFVRTSVPVARPAGHGTGTLDAWIYVYTGRVDGRARIVGETWPDYVARREGRRDPRGASRAGAR